MSLSPWQALSELVVHKIEIRSPYILSQLASILGDYGEVLAGKDMLECIPPFRPLYFGYKQILDLHKTLQGGIVDDHLTLLVHLMIELLGDTVTEVSRLLNSGVMSYKHLWSLFPTGILVYAMHRGQPQLYKFRKTRYVESSTNYLEIECQFVEYDGGYFGFTTKGLRIREFGSHVKITDLGVYPLGYHSDREVQERLVDRGKEVLDFQGVTYRSYAGVAWDGEEKKKYYVEGRVVVDMFNCGRQNYSLQRRVEKLPKLLEVSQESKQRPSAEVQSETTAIMMRSPQYLCLMSPFLQGYSLSEKRWLLFLLDDFAPILWNEEAFGHLVYDADKKDMVLSLVRHHQKKNKGTEDVIMGKGQGLVMLLNGPPGTGKTLTAEAVADQNRQPLYHLQAEELGSDASHLGPCLRNVLDLVTDWNAILLLDEADVFLSRRTLGDFKRNELASIFLRNLEYFDGIMFLTTNLVEDIDEAFESRIHIHLLFPSLDRDARLEIWQKFVGRFPEDVSGRLSEHDLKQIAAYELNGRQIKSVLKTTRAWCMCKGQEVTLAKLVAGIEVTAPRARRMFD